MRKATDRHQPPPAAEGGSIQLLPGRARSGHETWFVLHVRSRQEYVLARILGLRHVDHYLPLRYEERYQGSRRVRLAQPLFAGYIFLWGQPEDVYRADRTHRVVGVIRVPDQAGLERELSEVHKALVRNAPLTPHPALTRGRRVRVTAGPFMGLEGRVARLSRRSHVVLHVSTLGSAASLEIDRELLDLVN